ncbi:MAG: hypothetical protein ABIR58_05945 [Gemmatimonadaceae bacterium]
MTALPPEFHRLARLLVFVMPADYGDEIVGDLIEEARTVISPVSGSAAARRWVVGQLVSSLPHMWRLHLEKELTMSSGKVWGALAIVVMGATQAWDSGVLSAPPQIGAMVVLALLTGVVALFFSDSAGTRFAAAIISILILFGARMLSPVPLPELGLVGFVIMVVLIFVPGLMEARRNGPGGPTRAA